MQKIDGREVVLRFVYVYLVNRFEFKFYLFRCKVVGMVEMLGHLTLIEMVRGSKPPLDITFSVRRDFASSLLFQAIR